MCSNGLACDVFVYEQVIAWLSCRLFVDMVSQLSLEYNVSHFLIDDDLYMSIYVYIIC